MKISFKINPAFQRINANSIRRIFKHFGGHLVRHRGKLLQAGVCLVGVAAMELLRPWPIKMIFDIILVPQAEVAFLERFPVFGGNRETLLAACALSILLIAVLAGLFRYGQKYLTASVGQKVVASVRRQLYNHIQYLSQSFHNKHHSGDLVARLTGDIRMLRDLMVVAVIFVSENILILSGIIAVMFWMDWQLSLVALWILPFLVLVAFHFSVKIKKATKKQRRKESEITSVITETLASIEVVQGFGREKYESQRFSSKDKSSMKAGLKTTRMEANLNRYVEVLLAAGICAVLWFGVKKVLSGALTPGDLLVFTAYLRSLYKPIRRLASFTSRISKATVCGERIVSILEMEPEIKDSPGAIVAPPFQGEIIFENLSFSYRPGEPVLNGVDFKMNPGKLVALVGPSGSGKSTVASLLIRFYDPQKGRVLIDGRDLRCYTINSLREQISIVLQESLLFATTIRENISYGKLDASMEEIVAAAEVANAHDFIMGLANGYDTIVGERGGTLSGGQRHRIGIARAVIRNTPILILDEPMTGLEVKSKLKVREALDRLMVGKTCLFVTHDLQSVAGADQILSMEGGRIVVQEPIEIPVTGR
ncbi:MAG: ABC transporter ATP-binding protein [Nitrospira sp.]|nr:ABC transporter ATP-binding protein [Candidatus Manganitrophaceae bacterium]HIL34093.1 ABC transporter ATP-binding protein [Candidatus Manganitrophaceae bacterium]